MKHVHDSDTPFLPYDRTLREFCAQYRRRQTPAEKYLWELVLRKKQMLGLKFTQQKPLGNFIVYFYCSKILLVIEVDGEYHEKQREYDQQRTRFLHLYGITIIRFSNKEVTDDIKIVRKKIETVCRKLCERFECST
jgi:very-short-patch-repair endonuclease